MKELEQFRDVRERLPAPSVTVIYNPQAGIQNRHPLRARRFRENVLAIETLLGPDFLGLDVVMRPTRNLEHASDEIQAALATEVGAIAVIGGDGTLLPVADHVATVNEANQRVATISGILEHKTHILVFGGGTQNIFQRELSVNTNPYQVAAEILLQGSPRKVDLGYVASSTGRNVFSTNMGLGLDAHVLNAWERRGKTHRGELLPLALQTSRAFRPYDLQITDASEGIDAFFPGVLGMPIINAGAYAGMFPITDGLMDDGMLEAVIAPEKMRHTGAFLRMTAQATQRGRTIDGVTYLGLHHATIRETDKQEIIYQHDGEPERAGSSEITVGVLEKSITVWAAPHTKGYALRRFT